MRLYLIKRTSDGKFFGGVNGNYMLVSGADMDSASYWSHKPQMLLKTPDGVAANLRRLCSEPFWNTTPPKGVLDRIAVNWRELAWHNFDAAKLDLYEIVCMDVDVISMTATPASEFIQPEAIASIPLSKADRMRADA